MGIEEVTVSVPSVKKTTKTCNKCSKRAKVHVACFKCRNIYHAKCFLKVPGIYINEKGHIFCCQNLTSKYNSFESKLQAQENDNRKSVERGVCSSDDGLENSRFQQEEHEKDEYLNDVCFEKREILEELNRDRVGFVCSFCDVKCFDQKSYRRHIKLCDKNHLGVKNIRDEKAKKVYKCDECSFITKYRWNLKVHAIIHSREKPLGCMCKSCKCSQLPGRSQVKHYDCSICEYRTDCKKKLRQHVLRTHKKKHKCNYCTYSTPRMTYLIQHKHAHLGEKQFKCDRCEFKTAYKNSFASHLLVKHSNIKKKYKCDDCEFSSHRKDHLRRHMIIHSDEKPLKCNDCDFSCRRKDDLKMHMIMHSNEKNYKCNDCEYFSYRKECLRSHRSKKHKKQNVNTLSA